MIHLQAVLLAAEEVETFCVQAGWKFCFIGGVAVQRWGQPRLTQDADLTLLTGFGKEEFFADSLLAKFSGRLPDTRDFAVRNRVLLARTDSGIPLDIAFGAYPFEERSVERASPWEWVSGHRLLTCSAEDLLVHKVFAGRDRDWADVEGILVRQHGKLDLVQVQSELRPLLEIKGQLESELKLEALQKTVCRRLDSPLI